MPEVSSAKINPSNGQCPECGMLHPPTPPGECPLAKEKALKDQAATAGNQRLVMLVQAIQTKLLEKLKGKPEDYSTAVAQELFKYIERL